MECSSSTQHYQEIVQQSNYLTLPGKCSAVKTKMFMEALLLKILLSVLTDAMPVTPLHLSSENWSKIKLTYPERRKLLE